MLTLNRNINENTFEFVDEEWLFNTMDEINVELKEYKDNTYVDIQSSNRKKIYNFEAWSSKYNLTKSNKVNQIEESKYYYDKVTNDIKAKET